MNSVNLNQALKYKNNLKVYKSYLYLVSISISIMYRIIFSLFLATVILHSNAKAQTYNFYFGNIHAHSSYSDGNQDSSTSFMTKPLQDFNYAKVSQHVDFYGISEHNHYSAGMTNRLNYHRGIADANSANNDGSFVALYGMEWGVISGGGHVLVYGYDSLIGWDNNNYDVYVAKNDYASLWKKINERPGSFAYMAHPQSSDYSGLFSNTVNLSADNAIVGMAARSGPAMSTNTNYSNPSSGNYISRYNDALKRGYHVGVGLDHDTHNSVFGRQTAGRLVVLAPSLTRADILDGLRNMRFYSSDDWNLKVNYSVFNQPMGSIITYTGTPVITASVTDADVSENVASIAIYYGIPGSGTNPAILTTVTNTANLSYTHAIANNSTYYYYLKITQTDGDIVWTSPIWYTRNDALTNTPPVTAFTSASNTVCAGQPITFTDNTTNAPTTWDWQLAGALPATSVNKNVVATYYTPGTYIVGLTTFNAFGAGAFVTNTITVIPIPSLSVTSDTICKGESGSLTVTGAGTYLWSNGSVNPTTSMTPTLSTLYTVTGTLNGCSKTINTFIIVQQCVGIEEFSRGAVKLYPNPASEFVTVEFKNELLDKTVELYDGTGKQVMIKTSTESLLNLNISSLNNGIYLMKVKLEEGYAIEKLVIRRD